MLYVSSPNRWSCLPASFAMILDITFETMIRHIGHDGSEIVHPDLPEPLCRRTFHIDECTLVAVMLGHSITTLHFMPQLTTDGTHMIDIPMDTDYLLRFRGVLTGRGRDVGHAVAWDGTYVYDPSARDRYKLGENSFDPHTLYAIDIQSQRKK